ncbi:MAG: nucleoside triphosphate pyrophosphohydrolase [Flavobacteriia bacterium]|nr:MAG: nucleoside triphosphate pyrophosphohydrolase [Flavobacteriia bacterium]
MNPKRPQQLQALERLLDIMDDLRTGCPWDKEQTIESLRLLTIEETYELGDAILDKDMDEIKKELGDLLLHIVFYAKIADETDDFDIADVANSISDKLVQRHPHIYGDVNVQNADDVKQNWEEIKLKEGKKSVLEGVPKSLPALVKAYRIQDKAAGIGFDWDDKQQVWAKVEEEIGELQEEIKNKNQERINDEFGDVLFALINYARFINVSPENALESTNKRFINRFQQMEKVISSEGKQMKKMTLEELDAYWDKAKTVFP